MKNLSLVLFLLCGILLNSCAKESWESEITSIKASSSLEEKYSVENMIDKNMGTTWVEGNKDDGIGENFTITFKEKVKLNYFYISNGFSKSNELYNKNNRIKKMKVNNIEVEIEDKNDLLKIQLPKSITSNTFNFEISEVYNGSKWKDTCITEILFINEDTFKNKIENNSLHTKIPWLIGEWQFDETKLEYDQIGACLQRLVLNEDLTYKRFYKRVEEEDGSIEDVEENGTWRIKTDIPENYYLFSDKINDLSATLKNSKVGIVLKYSETGEEYLAFNLESLPGKNDKKNYFYMYYSREFGKSRYFEQVSKYVYTKKDESAFE